MKHSASILFRACTLTLVAMLVFTSSAFAAKPAVNPAGHSVPDKHTSGQPDKAPGGISPNAKPQSISVGVDQSEEINITTDTLTVDWIQMGNVSWKGFNKAASLVFGVEWTLDSNYQNEVLSTVSVKHKTSYAGNFDTSRNYDLVDVASQTLHSSCSFKPYVRLLDANGATLVTYYAQAHLDTNTMCIVNQL